MKYFSIFTLKRCDIQCIMCVNLQLLIAEVLGVEERSVFLILYTLLHDTAFDYA